MDTRTNDVPPVYAPAPIQDEQRTQVPISSTQYNGKIRISQSVQ